MNKLLQCGRFKILVIDKDNMLDTASPVWKYYLKATTEHDFDVQIFLKSGLNESVCTRNEFWRTDTTDAAASATYFSNRKAVFSMQYSSNSSKHVNLSINEANPHSLSIGLQHALMISLSKWCIGFHCVTVICKNKVFALSAPSGTGKTTLAKLLMKYSGAAIVNGDFALLSPGLDKNIIFEPTPFCGTSKMCFNVRLPLHEIVFLEQSPTSYFKEITTHNAINEMMNNTFTIEWDGQRNMDIYQHVIQIVENIPIRKFAFAPNEEAVKCFNDHLLH